MRAAIVLTTALALSSCATVQRAQSTVDRAVTVLHDVTATVDTVLARPAPLANTQVDENLIRGAYTRFDQGINIIRSLHLQRNSPVALRVQRGVIVVKQTLRRAYTAQRIGNAPTVRQALTEARAALTGLTADVQRGN